MDVPPLMSWMEIVPPGGRWRAYLARRVSIRRVVAVGVVDVVGAGRFRFMLMGLFVDVMS